MKNIVSVVVLSLAMGLLGRLYVSSAVAEPVTLETNDADVFAESRCEAVVSNDLTNAVVASAGSADEEAGQSDRMARLAEILEKVLRPVGKGVLWLIDRSEHGVEFLRDWCAEKTGVDKNGNLYFIIFTATIVGLFVLVWFGVKKLHANAKYEINHWSIMRFLGLASGILALFVSQAPPQQLGQAVAIPLGALVVTGLVAGFVGGKTSFGVCKALGLVIVDFLLGFLVVCIVKVLLAAVMIIIGLVVLFVILSLMGGNSSSSGSSRPSRIRMRCRDCGYTFYCGFFDDDKCPNCGSSDTESW